MNLFSLGGSRSMVAGVAVSAASAVLPVMFGSGAESAKVDLLDGTAWLSSESAGNVVRVNGETGRVDARLDLGQLAGELLVAQDDGIVLVNLGGQVRSIDLANLDWSAATEADGGLVVGDGAAYMVSPEGVVRELDSATLETRGYVQRDGATGNYRFGLAFLPSHGRHLEVLGSRRSQACWPRSTSRCRWRTRAMPIPHRRLANPPCRSS